MRKGLLLICAILCTNVLLAQDFFLNGNLGYNITGSNTVEVSYCDYDVLSVIIPATVTNYENGTIHTYNVTSIGIHAFSGRQFLSVTIPNSVTTIDSSAFEGCSNLISVTIPNSVTSIGSTAFYSCTSLTSVTIGNSVTSIGRWAFASCTNLTSITIPNSVTSIEYAAFSWCSNLTTVTIPNSVTYIGSYAFNECSDLTSVTIPNSVTFIEEGVFSKCSSLTSVNIPNSVTRIGKSAFAVCSSLTSVNIPNSVTSIGRAAFYNTGLTSVTLPNSVDTIGDYAFSNSALTSITIPENVRHVGIRAFGIDGYDIQSSLTTVVWNAKNVSNFYYDYNAPFSGCNNISTVTFGDSVKVIPNYLFNDCSSLTSVTLPNSVDTIGREAFYNTGLTSITIPENVKYIGDGAFGVGQYDESGNIIQSSLTTVVWNAKNVSNFYSDYNVPFRGRNNISTVTFGDSVKVIPNYIFNDCSSLTSVTLPNSVDTIGREAFYNTGLTSITIPENVRHVGYKAFGADEYGDIQSSLTTVVWNAKNAIHTGTGSSDWLASPFSGCRNISTVTFGDSVKIIDFAFFPYVREGITPNVHYGRDIESWINIERPIENEGSYSADSYGMFSGSQYNLYINNQLVTNLVIPNTIDTIQKYIFRDCSSIQSVTIPTQIKFIGKYAFLCHNINSITWNAINCNLEGQIFGDYYAFNTTSLVLGDSVQVIPDEAFVALGITNVNLPNSLTSIGEQAFLGCTNLASITIPSQVTTIGNGAFAECINLRSITMEPTVPPTIYSLTFDEVGTGVRVNVPCGTVEDYSTAPFWFNFSNIRQSSECVRTITAMSLNTSQGTVLGGGSYEYGSTATIAAIPKTGYQFYQWNDGDVSNPRSLVVSSDSSFIATFSSITTGGGVTHDTLYVDRYIYDTIYTTVHDTVSNNIYDTVIITNYDTIITTVYDTIIITINDTVTITQYDTIINTVYDTIINTVYDTITVSETYYTLDVTSTNSAQGIGAGSGSYPEGCVVTIVGLPMEGYRFVSWNDGNTDNPRQITISENASYVANFSTVDIEEAAEVRNLSVYPNPTNGVVTISEYDVNKVEIYDGVGKKVKEYISQRVLDMSDLSSGEYMLRITLPQGVAVRKVIKR